jgi:hypothetical protein
MRKQLIHQALMAVNMKMAVFWDVATCGSSTLQRFLLPPTPY